MPALLSPKSITVNLRPDLDDYVRRAAKQRKISMNELINQAVQHYRSRSKEGKK